MKIELENIGRRFNKEWIFKQVNYQFIQGESYAILGPNGSGKSTFMQVIAGNLSPSDGKISYSIDNRILDVAKVFEHLSLAAPYLELIEEFTLRELITYHFRFKKLVEGWDTDRIMQLLDLNKSENKEIKYFSSGMKQRTKLALACCADTPLLFLDEPTSNLDNQGIEWYHQLINDFSKQRMLIVCSNQLHEYSFCTNHLTIQDYK
ncbi:ABC transporter ATP-binding protein [Albibacterium sp.]|uniref:ABC transporter ATP-binding protein n=1 Tax=Albibacterium sp. TaxID=2952885 RepID=UPI002C8DADAE|nr:ABC transporter ATP-binding protein [Albibacterium sp.]HUH19855.1 ABC transporter ATP-binding protein [Albibacterium sp.]